MSPQAATAMQPVKSTAASTTPSTAPAKQAPDGDVSQQIQQTYDSIARRAFEIFENNGRWFGNDLGNWLRAEAERLQPVRLEIADSGDSLTVRAEVPGFNDKELEINLESRTLTITGKHETQEENKKGKTIYSERSTQQIMRVVELPAEVDASKVSATLKDGVLTVELPKAAQAKRVRIEPKTA